MKIIEKALNKWGYYKAVVPEGDSPSEKDVLEIFGAYGQNEMFLKFLRDACERDIKLYFQASTDADRYTIRGAHARTNYFISLVRKANERKTSGRKGN